MATGVSSNDFLQIYNDQAVVLSYKVVTKTTDGITGDESSSFATATNLTAIFFLEDQRYLWDKEGLLAVGDAYIIAKTSQGIKRYDQFTVDGQTYYIDKVVRRTVAGVAMQDYGTCFKV